MTEKELQQLLQRLLVGWEGECVEFKEANDNFSTSDIGTYFSALSNEANLRGLPSAWLVFGVNNKTRAITGTEIMFRGQANRYLPMPDYDTTGPEHVIMRLQGRFLDENYSRTLLTHADLSWPELLALDTIQKGLATDEETVDSLRRQGFIEGRRPHLHVASHIAAATETEAEYIKHRAFDDRYFCDLILDYLKTFGQGQRTDFERLLTGKLSDLLNDKQKAYKVGRLLQKLRREGKVRVEGQTRAGIWRLSQP
jgi:ATP-dependent DNA helicase RecG